MNDASDGPEKEFEDGDFKVKRLIQLARNKFSTRYMIMRRMEYFLEQLEEAPDGKKLNRLFCSCHRLIHL